MSKIIQKISYVSFIILSVLTLKISYSQSPWVLAGSVPNPGASPNISVPAWDVAWIADGTANAPKIFRTTNGGLNWTVIPVTGISHEIYCIWGMTANLAFAGEGIVNGNANLFMTTNGGINWVSILQTGSNDGYFNGLAFTKANGGLFGLALAERLYRSSNGGQNWIELNPGAVGVSNAQNSLMIIDNNFYGFGLNNGAARVRLTVDNSATWLTQQVNITGNYTSAIAFHTNKLYGLAATSTSLPIIGRTTDGGTTWSQINIGSGVTGQCYLNWVPLTPVVYILGANGGIKRSTDNGLTWVTTPVPNGVTSLTFFDFTQVNNVVYGYAVSSTGTVIKLVDTVQILTGMNTNTEAPSAYKLDQNYPNPFNPSTNIGYSVPKSSHVNISVYDALGRKVETLIDEKKDAGNYEAQWNASKYSSGLYFYKMQTEGYTETKKMILTK
jgi:photosystem II stability/assembly factor-like uncharacterized protein